MVAETQDEVPRVHDELGASTSAIRRAYATRHEWLMATDARPAPPRASAPLARPPSGTATHRPAEATRRAAPRTALSESGGQSRRQRSARAAGWAQAESGAG